MKNFDLSAMGVHEMSALEMQETDGGLICLIIAAVIILIAASASSCQTQISVQIGGANNDINNASQVADSTLNGNSLHVPVVQ